MHVLARFKLPRFARSAFAALATALVACGADDAAPVEPAPPPIAGECRNAQDFQSCLPNWQEYADPRPEQAPAVVDSGAPREVRETLERIDDEGETVSLGDVTFVCTDRTFNFLDNPERAVSFNIDETVIWPGALIQGRSHRDGTSIGQLLELPIRERAPVSLTVTFNNQDNSRTVSDPQAASVRAAIGSMIGNAQAEGLATPNNIDFSSETYASEQQAALRFGFSGRYMAFEATASGSIERSVTTNTVTAKLVQQMFVAGVTQPATPASFFSSAFSSARYKEHEALGRVGPNNPPLFVSRIGYGRMMVFAMSARAEASDMRATLETAWRGVGASAGASLSARQRAILQQSSIRITQVGGDQASALAAIRTGKLGDYFSNVAPLTSAAPLWFELKALTGEVATVSEPGRYTQTTCTPKLPGTFEFQSEQTLAVPFSAGTRRQVVHADVDGDGRMDLVFNERRSTPSLNRVHVARGLSDGAFQLLPPTENPNTPTEGWESFELFTPDIDGDGRADLAWNSLGTDNVVYTGASGINGSFQWRQRQVHSNRGWTTYTAEIADLNGDGRDDFVWSARSTASVRTYFGLAQSDGTFSMIANFVDRAGNYSGYSPGRVGQFTGDRYHDVVFNALGSNFNNTYVGAFTPTSATRGALAWTLYQRPGTGWTNNQFLIGDIDGRNGDDLLWVSAGGSNSFIWRSLNSGNATFSARPGGQTAAINGRAIGYVGDFNDDGRSDVLLNVRTANSNELLVGFGGATGDFTFPAGVQRHPKTPSVGWGPFDQVFIGDVNGDGKDDAVWTSPSSDARIYVALAK